MKQENFNNAFVTAEELADQEFETPNNVMNFPNTLQQLSLGHIILLIVQ